MFYCHASFKISIFKHSGYVIKNNKIISWCANESSKFRDLNNKDLTLLTLQTSKSMVLRTLKNTGKQSIS